MEQGIREKNFRSYVTLIPRATATAPDRRSWFQLRSKRSMMSLEPAQMKNSLDFHVPDENVFRML